MADSAREGHVVGAVVGIATKGRRYHIMVAGTLAKDPTFARGVCAAIDDELSDMVHNKAEAATTL